MVGPVDSGNLTIAGGCHCHGGVCGISLRRSSRLVTGFPEGAQPTRFDCRQMTSANSFLLARLHTNKRLNDLIGNGREDSTAISNVKAYPECQAADGSCIALVAKRLRNDRTLVKYDG